MDEEKELIGQRMERSAVVRVKEEVTENDPLEFVIVSTNNEGIRYDWDNGGYFTEYLEPGGADASELNTFFKDHNRSVDSAVGKIERVAISDEEVVAFVRFGTDEDSQTLRQKYIEGLLTDVSIGYNIEEYTREVMPNEPDKVTVTSYTIRELSAVGVGFDKGAKKRSQDNKDKDENMNEELMQRLAALEAKADRTADENAEYKRLMDMQRADEKAEIDNLKKERAELKRKADIEKLAIEHGVSDTLREEFTANEERTVEDFLKAALKERAEKQEKNGKPDVTVGDTANRDQMLRAMEDGFVIRMGGAVKDASADALKFSIASLSDIGRMLTGAHQEFDRVKLAERMMVTADFPNLLVNSGNRTLEAEFDAAATTYRQFTTAVDLPDFRKTTDITRGRGGRLDKIVEGGELKEKQLGEGAEEWKLSSFGNNFILTREMIVNDDLGAFNDMLSIFGEMAATTANGLSYDILLGRGDYSGYTMNDGYAIFDGTNHKNIVSGALSPENLGAARLLMRQQKGMDGGALNIVPAHLIVGPSQEQTAYEIIAAITKLVTPQGDQPNPGVPNFFQGSLNIIVDAEITGDEWFLSAARRAIKVGYLAGTGRRPQLLTNSSTLTKTIFEGVFDFGVMAADYRGLTKGA